MFFFHQGKGKTKSKTKGKAAAPGLILVRAIEYRFSLSYLLTSRLV